MWLSGEDEVFRLEIRVDVFLYYELGCGGVREDGFDEVVRCALGFGLGIEWVGFLVGLYIV